MNREASRVTVRQLCHLGVPSTLLLPSLIPVLCELVEASHGGFFFCDTRGTMTNLYAQRLLPPAVMAQYHDQHSEQQFRARFLERVRARSPISRRSVDAVEQQSAYYREVLTPLGIEHFLYAIVRHEGQAIGQLSLYRGADQRPFGTDDEQAMGTVLHYLGPALAVPAPVPQRDALQDSVEQGIAVLDTEGTELFADTNWSRLVRMAHGQPIAPGSARTERESLPRFVAAVMTSIASAPRTVHQVASPWGQFSFRLHELHGENGQTVMALLVSRQSSEPLRLAQGAAALGLSPQQREVALLMAQGHTNQAIAESLGITVNTAAYHAKQVFAKLNVHDRSALSRALSAAAAGLNG